MRKEKGITLVALIVTVVILIILAGVSLNLAFSDNGLIKKAEYAVNKSENSDENTQKKLNETKEWLDKNPDNDDAEPLPSTSETFPYYPSYKFDKTEDSDLDSGLVIEDRKGNQYVWVEVPKTNEVYPTAGINIVSFSSTEYTKIENDLHTYTSVYRKNTMSTDTYYSGCGLSSTSYDMLKQKMLKSVYQNGGFWIGRYETGLTNRYRTYGEEYYENRYYKTSKDAQDARFDARTIVPTNREVLALDKVQKMEHIAAIGEQAQYAHAQGALPDTTWTAPTDLSAAVKSGKMTVENVGTYMANFNTAITTLK